MTTTDDGQDNGSKKNNVPDSIEPERTRFSCTGATGYEIRVRDHLETYWFEWFDGWSVTNLENGEVLLKSDQVDQSKLHGALNKVRDLNLTLLSVTCAPATDNKYFP